MSEMNQGAAPPSGSWTHSFEEDEPGGILVYRPTHSFAFPPTRAGRNTIVFGEGGQLNQLAPGPDDRPRPSPGSWGALGMNRFALGGTAGAPEQVIEIIEANQDVLKIRKL
jgi:hypothetical protein